MSGLSILHVHNAQLVLEKAGIPSAVTGDVGLSYHGVDITIYTIELCVATADRWDAATALAADYEALPDLLDPDFYHPYKKGASRFLMRAVHPPLELHVVTDDALGLDLTSPGTITTGLSHATTHWELQDLCQDIDDPVLSAMTWPCLGPFLNGWLTLANRMRGFESEIIFLMEAERLIDANNIDVPWCEKHIKSLECREAAQRLVVGKERRQLGSGWD